jgi:hypothetical protein
MCLPVQHIAHASRIDAVVISNLIAGLTTPTPKPHVDRLFISKLGLPRNDLHFKSLLNSQGALTRIIQTIQVGLLQYIPFGSLVVGSTRSWVVVSRPVSRERTNHPRTKAKISPLLQTTSTICSPATFTHSLWTGRYSNLRAYSEPNDSNEV